MNNVAGNRGTPPTVTLATGSLALVLRVPVFLTLVCFTLGWSATIAEAQSELRFGGPKMPTAKIISFDEVSHELLDLLLRQYVDDAGLVRYHDWQLDDHAVQQLEAYLTELTEVDSSLGASREAKMAYYINAYNALTIWGILREYPVSSIQRIDGKRTMIAIFDDLKIWDGQAFRSLNGIENDVLRPMDDLRIHFALVCAARGCPRLRNRAYTPHSLRWQLDSNAREFFADRARFRLARLTETVHMSPILDWYREDFGDSDKEVVTSVMAYLPLRDQQWLLDHDGWKFKYLGYDWSLNDRCPSVMLKITAHAYHGYSIVSPWLKPVKRWRERYRSDPERLSAETACGASAWYDPSSVR